MRKCSRSQWLWTVAMLLPMFLTSGCDPQGQSGPKGQVRDPLSADLISKLQQGTKDERVDAATRLGDVKSQDAVPALINALKDPEIPVQGWAAIALGKIGDRSAIDPLIGAMFDVDAKAKESHSRKDMMFMTPIGVALSQLTGQDFGPFPEEWQQWRAEQIKKETPDKDK